MADLPFELQKLPAAALDVLRYFALNDNQPADDVTIIDGANLSDRSFSKAIKRLITKKFAEMDAGRRYKLTDKGVDLMDELLAYDEANGGGGSTPEPERTSPTPVEPVQRRLTVVAPEPLRAGVPTKMHLGFDGGVPTGQADILLQIGTLNAEPASQQQALTLNGMHAAYTSFQITPGEFTRMRLRIQAFQADPYSGDLSPVGGMYLDVDITTDENENTQLAAFGTDVTVLPA